MPLSSAAQAGNVKLVRGVWNTDFLDEIDAFPESVHDDQVDAASGAFGKLSFSQNDNVLQYYRERAQAAATNGGANVTA